MRTLSRALFAAALVGLLVASSALPSQARRYRHSPTRAFDGIWSVSIITQQGDCNSAYRYPLRVWYGRVYKADTDPNYKVSGAVAHSGAIDVTVSGGGRTARGRGRLSRSRGSGRWRTDSGNCSGTWTAERRPSDE